MSPAQKQPVEENSPKTEKKLKITFSFSKQKLHKVLNIAIILLLIAALMAAGALIFWFFQQKSEKKSSVATKDQVATRTQTTETDSGLESSPSKTKTKSQTNIPSDWKTYKVTKFGYQFKHPPDWYIDGSADNYVQILNYDSETAPPREYIPSIDKDLFKIEVVVNEKASDVDQWFAKRKSEPDPMTDEIDELLNVKKLKVDGYDAVFFECPTPMGTITGTTAFETPSGYLIHFWGGLNYPDHKSYYDQILSTVEFID